MGRRSRLPRDGGDSPALGRIGALVLRAHGEGPTARARGERIKAPCFAIIAIIVIVAPRFTRFGLGVAPRNFRASAQSVQSKASPARSMAEGTRWRSATVSGP